MANCPASRFFDLRGGIIDVHIHHVGHGVEREIPHVLANLRARHALAGIAHQILQQAEFLGCQLDRAARAFHRVFHAVQFQVLDAQHRIHRAPAAAQQRAHSRRKLRKREGPQHQIVRAQVQNLHAIFGAIAAGKHQDGQLAPFRADVLQHLRAFVARQIQIQNRQIVIALSDPFLGLFALMGQVHGVMFMVETFLQKGREGGIILGDEQTHNCSRGRGANLKKKT